MPVAGLNPKFANCPPKADLPLARQAKRIFKIGLPQTNPMNKSIPKLLVISYLSLVIILLPYLSPLKALAAYNQSTAKTYLQSHANTPWSIMGLVALGQTPNVDFLKNFSGSSAIDYAAPILALTAAGKDPKTFSGEDLVLKLKSFYTQNQLGDPATVNDDIFGTLALLSAGEGKDGQILSDVKNFILQNQNQDGGWGFALSAGSDSNTTAAAVVALKALGLSNDDNNIASALAYLKTAQNTEGGFTYDPQSKYGTASDSSSTAWVLWALNALNIQPGTWSKDGHSPADYLSSTQTGAGYFEWQTGSGENSFSAANTAYASIALAGKTLPLSPSLPNLPADEQYSFRIEGSAETICEGKTRGPSALDVVKNASTLCGFTYHIKDTSFGPYLDKIGDDEAAGSAGWQYWINNNSPSVGAADYSLKEGDEVLWAFGNFDIKPVKLTLDPVEISSGQSSRAKVEYFDGQAKPLEDAKIMAGTQEFTSGNDGQAAISAADGYYKIYAEKPGFVRSNKVLLKIGQPASSNVNLSVNVTGKVLGTSTPPSGISFTVEPANLDFGTLAAGTTGKKTFSLKNTGSQSLEFEAEVSGQLFKDNLKLDDKPWQKFKKTVSSGQSQTTEAALTIPPGVQSGKQNGKLIFWASSK